MRRELNRTKKSESNLGFETPGKPKAIEVISRRNTIPRKVLTEIIGKNRKTPKTPKKGLGMELGERTR